MNPYNGHQKWLPELAAYDELERVQKAEKAERDKLFAQGLLYKTQQDRSFSHEELLEEFAEIILKNEKRKEEAINFHAELAIVKRVIAEHKDCQSCPVCLTDPSPTLTHNHTAISLIFDNQQTKRSL